MKGTSLKMMQTFAKKYEGGHPMRDPEFLMKYREARALDPSYDIEKAKKTSRDRYGEDFYAQTDAAREKSRALMEKLVEEGKSFAGKNKKDCPDIEGFRRMYLEGVTLEELAKAYKVSTAVASRWAKEHSLERRVPTSPFGTSLGKREVLGEEENIRLFLEWSVNKKSSSFYQYSLDKGGPAGQRMKRLFNKGGKLESLKGLLGRVAEGSVLAEDFFKELREGLAG